MVSEKKFLKVFKSCCCCYQTAKARTLCVCNSKINGLRKKKLFKKFSKVAAAATKLRRPALYAFVIRKLIVSEKKVFKKVFKSCCCCYQTVKARTLCVCNSKINGLRKKSFLKKFSKVAAAATKLRRPALYAFVIRKLIVSEKKVF